MCMATHFQTAVQKTVPRETRLAAIDALAQQGRPDRLAVLVRMGGLRGVYRRHALKALASCSDGEALAELAEDRTIESDLQHQAANLRTNV